MAGVYEREQTSQELSTNALNIMTTQLGVVLAFDEIDKSPSKGPHDFNHVITKTWN